MKQYIRLFRDTILDNNTGGNTDSNTPIDYKNLHELSRLLYDKGFVDGLANPTEVNDTIKSFLSSPSKPISEEELDKLTEQQFPMPSTPLTSYKDIVTKRESFKQGYRLHVSREKELMEEVEGLKGDVRLVESLTPSGSEYVGDVKACVSFVKDKMSSDLRFIQKTVIESKVKDQRMRELEDALEEIGNIVPSALGMLQVQDIVKKSLTTKPTDNGHQ